MLHVNIIILHADINKSHINIIMLHVNIMYHSFGGGGGKSGSNLNSNSVKVQRERLSLEQTLLAMHFSNTFSFK